MILHYPTMKLKAHKSATYLALLDQIFNLHLQTWENNQEYRYTQNFFHERKIAGAGGGGQNPEEPGFHKGGNVQNLPLYHKRNLIHETRASWFQITTKPQKSEYSNDIGIDKTTNLEKKARKSQLKNILQNIWSINLRTVKVKRKREKKKKESLRNGHRAGELKTLIT